MNRLKYSLFYLFSFLPFWVVYLLSDFTCFFVYHVIRYRREVVSRNMSRSFPEKTKVEIKKLEKAFYRHFCDQMFESIKVLSISENAAKKRLVIKNPELIHHLYEEGRGIILYSGHFGNWEWTSFLPLHFSHLPTAFYKPLSNGYYDGLIKQIRQRFGLRCIEAKMGFKTLAQLKQNGVLTMSMILSDQSPGKDTNKEWVTFLNQDTAFVLGAHRMAKKLDQAILFPSFKKPKRGHYELEFIPITSDPRSLETKEAVEAYVRILEHSIRATPSLWLWTHRRWKLKWEDT